MALIRALKAMEAVTNALSSARQLATALQGLDFLKVRLKNPAYRFYPPYFHQNDQL